MPNGLSWENAFSDLQDAFALAESEDHIYVAQGIYTPSDPNGSRFASYRIHNNLSIYGGFPTGGSDWQERDPNMYETVLSGDLNNNDLPDFVNYEENSYHLIMGFADFTLDGFTIKSGNADGQVEQLSGGGMYLSHSNASINNCIITMNMSYGSPVYIINYSHLIMNNSKLISNKTEDNGGAMKLIDARATLDNCDFISNAAGATQAGGAISASYSYLILNNCNFSSNTAKAGGAIRDGDCIVIVNNCVFTGNSALYGGVYYTMKSELEISNSKFYDNWTYSGTGFSDGSGAVFYCESNDIFTLKNCTFKKNRATQKGGAVYMSHCDIASIDNCIMDDNYAAEQGGALYISFGTTTINNCTIVNNSADIDDSGYGDGIYAYGYFCELNINNSILWNNLHDQISKKNMPYPYKLFVNNSCIQGGYSGTNNISSDPYFADEAGGDYHLKSQAGRWDHTNMQWVTDTQHSACIDKGDTASDRMGELWPHGKRINMGAYGGTAEASMSLNTSGNIADFDNDDDVDLVDFSSLAGYWLSNESLLPEDISRDGDVDLADLALFSQQWLW